MKRIIISYVRNNVGYKSVIKCNNHEEVLHTFSTAIDKFMENSNEYEYYYISVLDYHI